jgi:hypothetical protein
MMKQEMQSSNTSILFCAGDGPARRQHPSQPVTAGPAGRSGQHQGVRDHPGIGLTGLCGYVCVHNSTCAMNSLTKHGNVVTPASLAEFGTANPAQSSFCHTHSSVAGSVLIWACCFLRFL